MEEMEGIGSCVRPKLDSLLVMLGVNKNGNRHRGI